MLRKTLLLVVLATASLKADGYISHIVDGGSWKTSITLVNNSSAAQIVTIYFWGEDGLAMSLPILQLGNYPSVKINLAPYGSNTIETEGIASTLSVGWASISK